MLAGAGGAVTVTTTVAANVAGRARSKARSRFECISLVVWSYRYRIVYIMLLNRAVQAMMDLRPRIAKIDSNSDVDGLAIGKQDDIRIMHYNRNSKQRSEEVKK